VTSVQKTDEEWRAQLGPERYAVLRQGATEPPFSGELYHVDEDGMYRCGACGAELFRSGAKFESGSGWPSFFEPVSEGAIEYEVDRSHGMRRTEIRCGACGSHLGHVFPDGPEPTGQRYCVNSLALDLERSEE
jgi:peptide-methionine (R)-S-oxide reductase